MECSLYHPNQNQKGSSKKEREKEKSLMKFPSIEDDQGGSHRRLPPWSIDRPNKHCSVLKWTSNKEGGEDGPNIGWWLSFSFYLFFVTTFWVVELNLNCLSFLLILFLERLICQLHHIAGFDWIKLKLIHIGMVISWPSIIYRPVRHFKVGSNILWFGNWKTKNPKKLRPWITGPGHFANRSAKYRSPDSLPGSPDSINLSSRLYLCCQTRF